MQRNLSREELDGKVGAWDSWLVKSGLLYAMMSIVAVVIALFEENLVVNEGVSFGIGRVGTPVILLLFVVFFVWSEMGWRSYGDWEKASVGMIRGGALGNLVCRVIWGGVIDYLRFLSLFVFNLADVFITLGCVVLVTSIVVSSTSRSKDES